MISLRPQWSANACDPPTSSSAAPSSASVAKPRAPRRTDSPRAIEPSVWNRPSPETGLRGYLNRSGGTPLGPGVDLSPRPPRSWPVDPRRARNRQGTFGPLGEFLVRATLDNLYEFVVPARQPMACGSVPLQSARNPCKPARKPNAGFITIRLPGLECFRISPNSARLRTQPARNGARLTSRRSCHASRVTTTPKDLPSQRGETGTTPRRSTATAR